MPRTVTVTIPDDVAERLDALRQEHPGVSQHRLIVEALRHAIGPERPRWITRAGDGRVTRHTDTLTREITRAATRLTRTRGDFTAGDLIDAVTRDGGAATPASIRTALHRLHTAGRVQRLSRGRYTLDARETGRQ